LETDLRRDATVEAIDKVMPSVVNIATATIVERAGDPMLEHLRRYFGWRVPTEQHEEPFSIGSGVIVDEDGYILTNFHVLEHAARVQVKLWNGTVYDADPLVYTLSKDVALLKLRDKPGEKLHLKAIKFAKDDDLLLGETVLALGNPYGLGGSVTRGILSSKNRRPTSGNEPLGAQDWLQTDADINPGNSGGPLINLRGELIGINVAVYREGQGMGVSFAIPVKQISSALADFFQPEIMHSLWLGTRITTLAPPLTIASVQPGSPAEKAGVREGQRIIQVNGKTPRSLVDFSNLVTTNMNHSATLEVEQNGARRTITAQLVPLEDLVRQKLGLTLLNLTPQTAASFPVKPGEGLYISEVEKNSPAERAQLQRGYLLTAIDGQTTGELMKVAILLSTKAASTSVQLSVVVPRRLGSSYVQFQQGTATVQVR